MRTSKYLSDSKRWNFRNNLLTSRKKTTVLGYLSALSTNSLIGEWCNNLFNTNDVFDITTENDLKVLYQQVVKDKRNTMAHSRYSAALSQYMSYVNQNDR